ARAQTTVEIQQVGRCPSPGASRHPLPEGEGLRLSRAFSRREKVAEGRMRGRRYYPRVLDVAVEKLSLGNRIRDVTLTFPRSTHTAIVGPPSSGASTLLQIISGELRTDSGEIRIGARNVTRLPARRRPVLLARSRIDAPGRWSVGHLLIAAVRQRTPD